MLIQTTNELFLPFLRKPNFSSKFSVYIFKGKRLTQKWIAELLSKEENEAGSKKLNEKIFSIVKDFFKSEPMQFSHLMIGNNIFCYYDNNEKKLINLYFDGNSSVKEKEITENFYSGRKNRRETFFWLFSEVTGEARQKLEDAYMDAQKDI